MLEHLTRPRSFHSSAVYRKIPPFVSSFPMAVLSWPSELERVLTRSGSALFVVFILYSVAPAAGFKPAAETDGGLLCSIVQLHFTFARTDMSDVMHVISADQTEQWEKEKC